MKGHCVLDAGKTERRGRANAPHTPASFFLHMIRYCCM